MSKFLLTGFDRFALPKAICEKAGINPNSVRRIVLDLQAGSPGVMYVELLADESVLDVDLNDIGVSITRVPL